VLTESRRIRALKLGEDPRQPPQQRSVALEEAPVNSDPMSAPHLATHVSTTLNDPIEHPTTSLSALLTNATIPNKFRIQARVKSVHPRGLAGNQSLVQKHCTKCDRLSVPAQHHVAVTERFLALPASIVNPATIQSSTELNCDTASSRSWSKTTRSSRSSSRTTTLPPSSHLSRLSPHRTTQTIIERPCSGSVKRRRRCMTCCWARSRMGSDRGR